MIDVDWGKSIWGVTLQIELSDKVKDRIDSIQRVLNKIEPSSFLIPPKSSQHISFNQVVFWNGNYALGAEKTWTTISKEFVKKFKQLDGKFDSFNVNFRKLIATKSGVIYCAYDNADEMQKLRAIFLEELPFPKETTKFNQIIHTTVARYKEKLTGPEKILNYVEGFEDNVEMKVKRINLKKELVFPSLKTQTIASINLRT